MTITTLYPDYDLTIYSASSTSNLSSSTATALWIGEDDTASDEVGRGLFWFDMSSIPVTDVITTAKLRLYITADYCTNARTWGVHRVLRAWVFEEATWEEYSSGNSWGSPGGNGVGDLESTGIGTCAFGTSDTGWKEFDIEPDRIKEMVTGAFTNNGFHVRVNSEVDDQYEIDRYFGTYPPELYLIHGTSGRSFQSIVIG